MGVQVLPLPTAVLSNQTAFESYASTSLTGQLACSINEWKKQRLVFDAVTTGFLMNVKQASLVGEFLDYARSRGAMIVVDPVMGDGGSLYPIYKSDMCKAFIALVRRADVITPNLTEACLLAGIKYPEDAYPDHGFVWDIAEQLSSMGPHTVVVTGVNGQNGQICNIAYLARQNKRLCVTNRRIGGSYSGTGDILSAVICGSLLRGDGVESALRLAGELFEKAISLSLEEGTDPREGIALERFLHILIKA